MKNATALPYAALVMASIVAAVGAGCANGNLATPTTPPTPIPSPTASCTPPAGETIQMVFPQNGSLNAANLQGIVVAVAPNPLPTSWFFYVVYNATTSSYPNTIGVLATPAPAMTPSPGSTATPPPTPSPLPTPSDTPSSPALANPIYESASLGTFATSSRFTVYLASAGCYPGIAQSTFTTATVDTPTASPSPTST